MCACAIWSIQHCHKVGGTSVRMGFRTNWVSKWTLHHFTQLYCTNLPALNKHIPVVPSSLGLVWGVRAFGSSCSQLVLQPPECWPMPAIGPCTWPQSICSSSGLGCRCWGQVRPAVAGMVEVTLSLVWLLWIGCSRIAAEATECCCLELGWERKACYQQLWRQITVPQECHWLPGSAMGWWAHVVQLN